MRRLNADYIANVQNEANTEQRGKQTEAQTIFYPSLSKPRTCSRASMSSFVSAVRNVSTTSVRTDRMRKSAAADESEMRR
jgi:hypothetical protein